MKVRTICLFIVLIFNGCGKEKSESHEKVIFSVDNPDLFFELKSSDNKAVKASSLGSRRFELKGFSVSDIAAEIQQQGFVRVSVDSSVNLADKYDMVAYFKTKPIDYPEILQFLADALDMTLHIEKATQEVIMFSIPTAVSFNKLKEFNKLSQEGSVIRVENPTPSFLATVLNRYVENKFHSQNDSMVWVGRIEFTSSQKSAIHDVLREVNAKTDTINKDFNHYRLFYKAK